MKYYIRATNTETGKTMIMHTPVFTSRKKAESFAQEFIKTLKRPVAKLEVITQHEK